MCNYKHSGNESTFLWMQTHVKTVCNTTSVHSHFQPTTRQRFQPCTLEASHSFTPKKQQHDGPRAPAELQRFAASLARLEGKPSLVCHQQVSPNPVLKHLEIRCKWWQINKSSRANRILAKKLQQLVEQSWHVFTIFRIKGKQGQTMADQRRPAGGTAYQFCLNIRFRFVVLQSMLNPSKLYDSMAIVKVACPVISIRCFTENKYLNTKSFKPFRALLRLSFSCHVWDIWMHLWYCRNHQSWDLTGITPETGTLKKHGEPTWPKGRFWKKWGFSTGFKSPQVTSIMSFKNKNCYCQTLCWGSFSAVFLA